MHQREDPPLHALAPPSVMILIRAHPVYPVHIIIVHGLSMQCINAQSTKITAFLFLDGKKLQESSQ